jgi:diguanylate cyclase (GGDEF)-like protein
MSFEQLSGCAGARVRSGSHLRAVSSVLKKTSGVRRAARAAPRVDLSAQVKARAAALRGRLDKRDIVLEAARGAHASLEPERVTAWLVEQMDAWLPMPCWVVFVPDETTGAVVPLAQRGLTQQLTASAAAAAAWVLRHGSELFSADLAQDNRTPASASATAMAFPLSGRKSVVGALVGLDPLASRAAPVLPAELARTIRGLLEIPGTALDNALAFQRIDALSVTDDLTKLYNSRYLNQALRRETKRAIRGKRPLSVLFLDLDGFKGVNDSHGHLLGSKALVEAADLVRGCARETDVVARFGGDEFSLVLPETSSDGAVAVAERIRDRFRSYRFLASDGLSMRLTASIGVATLPDVAETAEELLRAADTAMYRVKASGKDGVLVAQE